MNFDIKTLETIITVIIAVCSTYFALKGKIDKLELLFNLQTETIKEFRTTISVLTSEIEEMKAVREYKEKQKLNQ